MSDAIRVFVRYDITDEKGETRRERNERFGYEAPALDIPEAGLSFWRYYFDISSRLLRVQDGIAVPISRAEMMAWLEMSDVFLRPLEIQIIFTMDDAFCEAMNLELKAKNEKGKENGGRE